jgi:hypothetical protein
MEILEALRHNCRVVGEYYAEIIRGPKSKKKRWECEGRNTIVNEGKNASLNYIFNDLAQPAAWYMGLVDTALGGSFGVGTTASQIENASHIPEYTDYDSATRPEWTAGNASSQAVTNSTPVSYVFSTSVADDVIPGFFIVSVNTKSATTGVLWCAVNFSGGSATVDEDDTLNVTYTVTFS